MTSLVKKSWKVGKVLYEQINDELKNAQSNLNRPPQQVQHQQQTNYGATQIPGQYTAHGQYAGPPLPPRPPSTTPGPQGYGQTPPVPAWDPHLNTSSYAQTPSPHSPQPYGFQPPPSPAPSQAQVQGGPQLTGTIPGSNSHTVGPQTWTPTSPPAPSPHAPSPPFVSPAPYTPPTPANAPMQPFSTQAAPVAPSPPLSPPTPALPMNAAFNHPPPNEYQHPMPPHHDYQPQAPPAHGHQHQAPPLNNYQHSAPPPNDFQHSPPPPNDFQQPVPPNNFQPPAPLHHNSFGQYPPQDHMANYNGSMNPISPVTFTPSPPPLVSPPYNTTTDSSYFGQLPGQPQYNQLPAHKPSYPPATMGPQSPASSAPPTSPPVPHPSEFIAELPAFAPEPRPSQTSPAPQTPQVASSLQQSAYPANGAVELPAELPADTANSALARPQNQPKPEIAGANSTVQPAPPSGPASSASQSSPQHTTPQQPIKGSPELQKPSASPPSGEQQAAPNGYQPYRQDSGSPAPTANPVNPAQQAGSAGYMPYTPPGQDSNTQNQSGQSAPSHGNGAVPQRMGSLAQKIQHMNISGPQAGQQSYQHEIPQNAGPASGPGQGFASQNPTYDGSQYAPYQQQQQSRPWGSF